MAQLAEAEDLKSLCCRFESDWGHGQGATMQTGPMGVAGFTVTVAVGPPADVSYAIRLCSPVRIGVHRETLCPRITGEDQ